MSFFVSKSLEGLVDEEMIVKNESTIPYSRRAKLEFVDSKSNSIFFKINEIEFKVNELNLKIEASLELLEILKFENVKVKNILFKSKIVELKSFLIQKVKFYSLIDEYLVELSCRY